MGTSKTLVNVSFNWMVVGIIFIFVLYSLVLTLVFLAAGVRELKDQRVRRSHVRGLENYEDFRKDEEDDASVIRDLSVDRYSPNIRGKVYPGVLSKRGQRMVLSNLEKDTMVDENTRPCMISNTILPAPFRGNGLVEGVCYIPLAHPWTHNDCSPKNDILHTPGLTQKFAIDPIAHKCSVSFDPKAKKRDVKEYIRSLYPMKDEVCPNPKTEKKDEPREEDEGPVLLDFKQMLEDNMELESFAILDDKGRMWRKDGSAIRLNKGAKMCMRIKHGEGGANDISGLFGKKDGMVALFNHNSREQAVRRTAGRLYVGSYDLAPRHLYSFRFWAEEQGKAGEPSLARIEMLSMDKEDTFYIGYDERADEVRAYKGDKKKQVVWKVRKCDEGWAI